MNRLTDEDIKEIVAQLEGTEFDDTPIVLFAKQVQKLRKENEMLRDRVEAGEQMDWLITRELDNMDHIAEKAFRFVRDKWRESGVG